MRIATVGDNCMDVYESLGRAFAGGNPVNVAVYMARMGEHASYTGVVGDDDYGGQLRDALSKRGVDLSHLHTLPGKTAVTLVDLVDGERVFRSYDEGVHAFFRLDQGDVDFLCSHDMVVSGIWGKVEGDLAAIHARGIPVAYDFANKLTSPLIKQVAPSLSYAFFSWDGAADREISDFMKQVRGLGAGNVIVTRGEEGSVAYDGSRFHTFGILPCTVVDTMGAGDSYIAGFLRGALLGEDIPACMRMGAQCSCETLGYMGAW